MYIKLFLILLFITSQTLFANNDNKSPFPPSSQSQDNNNIQDLVENNPKEIIVCERRITKCGRRPTKDEIIAIKKRITALSSKNAEKLTKEIARSKKMACQTGIGVGFVFFIKTIGDANNHFMLNNVIAVGSIFCLISLWETLKTGYNISRYIYKKRYCKLVLPFLDQEIEKLDKADQKFEVPQ